MEIKKHFKLYKSGKQWVTAAVATVAVSTALLYGELRMLINKFSLPQPKNKLLL
ncbi:KxYKxGKxW signal peptide domain-containing protein [Limosilactobacillus reuteri]|nr:KxYKxGKxW signal peptide domain-containing protein [Limosilactobacillus reuteri]